MSHLCFINFSDQTQQWSYKFCSNKLFINREKVKVLKKFMDWGSIDQQHNGRKSPIHEILSKKILSKSHAKRVWGSQNLFNQKIFRSPNSLRMGFTFLMDANTSKYFYNYFMGMMQTLINY